MNISEEFHQKWNIFVMLSLDEDERDAMFWFANWCVYLMG